MNRSLIIIVFLSICINRAFPASDWFEKLDSAIDVRHQTSAEKERKIARLRNAYANARDDAMKLKLLDILFNEYQTYRYDSAMVYAELEQALAVKTGNTYCSQLTTIRKARLNANGGYYVEAEKELNQIDTASLSPDLRREYYLTRYWYYMYMGEYINTSNNSTLKMEYRKNMESSLCRALQYIKKGSPEYMYYMGEKLIIVDGDNEGSLKYYMRTVNASPVKSRLYASAAFSIAGYYKFVGNMEAYEQWAIKAAIGDMLTPLKDNYALQELAVYLFKKKQPDITRATRYIYISLEDAMFFDSRLRIIEISKKLPIISIAYTKNIERQKKHMVYAITGLISCVLMVLGAAVFINKQKVRLNHYRRELQKKNEELSLRYDEANSNKAELENLNNKLHSLNDKLTVANSRLNTSNSMLREINKKREGLAKIYIDLCAKYIDKLKRYQTFVQRKIKANQASELLNTLSSTRISEEDAATFMNKFDKAFLDLYPTFVAELNSLLLPDGQIMPKQPHSLTTELRIYALIRLGVNESSEIAELLFYSPQTIYNYRSAIRNKAINKKTFDEDVRNLC